MVFTGVKGLRRHEVLKKGIEKNYSFERLYISRNAFSLIQAFNTPLVNTSLEGRCYKANEVIGEG